MESSSLSPQKSLLFGALPGEEEPPPDPRWPSLARWSSRSTSSTSKSPVAKLQLNGDASSVMLPKSPSTATTQNQNDSIIHDTSNSDPTLAPVETSSPAKIKPSHSTIDPIACSAKLLNPRPILVSQAAISSPSQMADVPLPPTAPPGACLGDWAKPISLLSDPESSLISSNRVKTTIIPSSEMWPSLKASQIQGTKNLRNAERVTKQAREVVQVSHKHVSRVEDDIRFPWAAKMNPASRNLYRATEPEFLEDGTPKVTIPKHILLQGLENQKEYILGQFYRCLPPPGGLIFAVFNKIWGRNCKITIRKLGDSNYLFHIPDESTRSWVLQRGLWHVDDCLMFVAQWTPEASLDIPEIKTIPIWVSLKKIPSILYSIPGISHIASGLGAPMATHKPRLDPILIGEAKILVEVELSKAFPTRIAACDDNGFISMVDVEYAWLPTKCDTCGQLGHKVKRCLQSVKSAPVNAATDSTSSPTVPTSTPIVSTTRSDCVHVNLTTSKEASKDKFVAASDGHLAAPDAGFVAAPAPEPEVTHEAAPEVVVIDEVPPEDQTVSALEVSAIVTKLAVTTEAAPSENETATPNEVVSTSHYVSSSGNNLRSTNAFEFSAIKENNRIGDLGNSDGSSSDSDSEYLYETTAATTSKRGRLVKPSQKKQQMDWTTIQRGRGNRGRGHRGRRGGRG